MIKIEEKQTSKLPGITSLFVSFDYNASIVEAIKTLPNYTYDKKTFTWEIPITSLAKLLNLLNPIDDITLTLLPDKKEKKPKEITLSDFKTEPYYYQKEGIIHGLRNDRFLLLDQPGLGKAMTLDTKVYTPDGYKLLGELQVGDLVFSSDGKPTRVSAIYDHTNLKMYEVTFSDNTKVKCCEDHLWEIHTKTRGKLIRPLKWLLSNDQLGKQRKINKFWVPQTEPVQFNTQEVPIHPYVLGCLLGDGSISVGSVNMASADQEIIDRINTFLPESYYCKEINSKYSYIITSTNINNRKGNEIKNALKALNLYGTKSSTKFIPEIYKYNSIENRLELLRGLLDTDGFASKENIVQFSTNSIKLRDDIIFIAESLGGICSTYSKIPKLNGKECVRNYIVTLKFADPTILFTLPRKKEKLKPRRFLPHRKFKSIVPIDEHIGRCITVESTSSLYVIDHFIVTHNTIQLTYLAEELKEREGLEHCLVICGINTLKANWKKEIEQHSKLDCRILGERISKKGKYSIGSIKERLEDLKNPIKEFFIIVNIETLRNDDIVKAINNGPNKIDMIVVDEIHTCLKGDSIIQTDQGELDIFTIVNNNINCKVKSYNEVTNEIEYNNILNYYKLPYKSNLLHLEFEDHDSIYSIDCTPEHKIYTKNRGYVEAQSLNEEDIIEFNKN